MIEAAEESASLIPVLAAPAGMTPADVQQMGLPQLVALQLYLLEARREALLLELGPIENVLIQYGRLKARTKPPRVR